MVGAIMCTATAWVLIPSLGWRAFVCATAIPSGVCVVSLQFCDESPKFLVVNGSVSEGEDILKRVYRTNHKTELPVDLDLGREVTVIANGGAQRSWNFKRLTNPREVYKGVISMQQKVVPMFDAVSGLLRISLILLLNWVGLSYGFYGLSLWLPQYFKNLDDMDIYRSTMIVAFAQLPGNIFSALFLDSMSRSRTLCISLVIMGVSVCTLPFLQDQSAAILASCFFNGFSVLSWNALDVATVELYPTHIRSTAFGVLSAAGRLGAICANLTFGLLMRAQPLVPLVVAGSMMVVSGVFVLGLPTTSQRTGHS
ncbi:hypothetical protein SARC_09897 [Sphaeroforma arctica JP610]|uniref:Major facilitator superfamily (MFS) profile domain-containing protein n=1 Tax=Sphaeroforma arctica JP610 TaxID=667725 RepID=A0A0L0FLJ3_9EUKA|nr:hypothetical protein SARC_09897 [Sphaeroforma arctica JP610]KNC77647.1 hypothetical protein SARC_09897 [Sphaeroforma arctica JP610]|eukprot:XP_014151549.1 hypothetical protein SARC_09897 [Sphaeroforma arctica JP610]